MWHVFQQLRNSFCYVLRCNGLVKKVLFTDNLCQQIRRCFAFIPILITFCTWYETGDLNVGGEKHHFFTIYCLCFNCLINSLYWRRMAKKMWVNICPESKLCAAPSHCLKHCWLIIAMSPEMLKTSIGHMSLKISYSRLQRHLPVVIQTVHGFSMSFLSKRRIAGGAPHCC